MFSNSARLLSKSVRRPAFAQNVVPHTSKRLFSFANNPVLQGQIGGAQQQMSKAQQLMWIGAGGAATFALLSMAMMGLQTRPESVPTSHHAYSTSTRARLLSTYGHVVGGLASTALIAGGMFRSGVAHRLQRVSPLMMFGGTLVLTIGSMIATQSIDYERSPVMKHLAWTGFNAAVALSLCPLGVLGGPLLYRAALGTAAIMGSLSLIAATAPSDQFLNMGGILGIGLGVVIAASLGQIFFPASSMLYNVSVYGGLGVFSLFTLYDTQRLLQHVKAAPGNFDPVNASMSLYLDTINIFVRMVMIMSGGQRRRR